jgi:hypothetical protein
MRSVSASGKKWVSSVSSSELAITHFLPPVSLIASQDTDVRVRALMTQGDEVEGVEVEDGRR